MGEPRRTCVGCRRVRPKNEMIRIVAGPEGRVEVDRSGSAPGRGAYVCDEECANAARGRFGRALRAPGADASDLAATIATVQRDGGM